MSGEYPVKTQKIKNNNSRDTCRQYCDRSIICCASFYEDSAESFILPTFHIFLTSARVEIVLGIFFNDIIFIENNWSVTSEICALSKLILTAFFFLIGRFDFY